MELKSLHAKELYTDSLTAQSLDSSGYVLPESVIADWVAGGMSVDTAAVVITNAGRMAQSTPIPIAEAREHLRHLATLYSEQGHSEEMIISMLRAYVQGWIGGFGRKLSDG